MSVSPTRSDSIAQRCAYCKEELGEEPVKVGSLLYCCSACAFEAERSRKCQPERLTFSGPDSLCSRGNQV